MRRIRLFPVVAIAVVLAATVARADIKTQNKDTFQMGGPLGGLMNRFAGDAAKDGALTSVAIKGNRKMTMGAAVGQIIDLSEEKVYNLDIKKKEYKVVTFAELRQQWQDAQAKAKKDIAEVKEDQPTDPQQSGKEFEFDIAVKETGQTKAVAGHNTREVVVTVTMREKGKTLDESGGLVLTNVNWLAPKIAALDEIGAFDLKFMKAIYGDLLAGFDAQQLSMILASHPSFKEMQAKMAAEGKKLQGTSLASSMELEAVKSAAQMAGASTQSAPPPTTGGGLMGRLAGKMAPKPKAAEKRSKAFSSGRETITIDTTVADTDVSIPAGFKEKK
jgi:hypothetical protein